MFKRTFWFLFFFQLFILSSFLRGNEYFKYEFLYSHLPENDPRGLKIVKESIKTAKKSKDYFHLSWALEDAVFFAKDAKQKLFYANEAIDASLKTKDPEEIARAYQGKGIVLYYNFSDYSGALKEYITAGDYLKKSKDEYLIHKNHFQLGKVRMFLAHYDVAKIEFEIALDYFKTAYENSNSTNEKNNLARGYLNSLYELALLSYREGNLKKSSEYIEEGLSVLEHEKNFPLEKGKFLSLVGIDKYLKVDYELALQVLENANTLLAFESDKVSYALNEFYLGKVLLSLDKEAQSRSHLLKVDSLFSAHGFNLNELKFNYQLLAGTSSNLSPKEELHYTKQLRKSDSIRLSQYPQIYQMIYGSSLENQKPQTGFFFAQLQNLSTGNNQLTISVIVGCVVGFFLILLFLFKSKLKSKFQSRIKNQVLPSLNFASGNLPEIEHLSELEPLKKNKVEPTKREFRKFTQHQKGHSKKGDLKRAGMEDTDEDDKADSENTDLKIPGREFTDLEKKDLENIDLENAELKFTKLERTNPDAQEEVPGQLVAQSRHTTKSALLENGFTEAQYLLLEQKLTEWESVLGFLKPDITVNSLARELEVSAKLLSFAINHKHQMKFKTYINRLKIEYIAGRLKENPKYQNYTIEALALECGIASRQVFTRLFNQFCGEPPTVLIERLRAEKEKSEFSGKISQN